MAVEFPVELTSAPANASLATAVAGGTNPQFLFGALDANGNIGINNVQGGVAFGVINSIPAYANDAVTILAAGVSKVTCGAALAPGTRVMSDSQGRAIPLGAVSLGTLTTALVAGTPVTALAVSALSVAVPAGALVTVTSGSNTQTFEVTTAAAASATSLTVTSETPNFSYPTASTVTDATASVALGTVTVGTANANEIASVQLGVI